MVSKTYIPSNETPGRTSIKINWDEANFALQAGCTGAEIAESLGCNKATFYYQVEKKYKIKYQHHLQNLRRKGLNSIKMKQYQIAMKGNVTMLIWLGKQYLGQKEDPKGTKEFDGKLNEFLDALKNIKNEKDFKDKK
jgi:hypothetical protein